MYRDMVRAARAGNTYAMLSLAYCYQNGIYVDMDLDEAVNWYKQSAAKGCGRARWELAKFYRDGILVSQNSFEYIHWLTAAAESGIPEAMVELSKAYGYGVMLPKDDNMVVDLLEKAAALEYPYAEFVLGYLYKNGITVEKDTEKADALWERTRQHGDAELFYDIGFLLEFGDGLFKPDHTSAVGWYKLSSDMGSSKGYYCYMKIRNTSSNGSPETMAQRLAKLTRLPVNLEIMQSEMLLDEADQCMDLEDYDGALDKYRESADLGNADAMFMLSMFYRDGEIVKRNPELYMQYLTRSALCGNTDAQVQLARCYETGDGVEKSINEAMDYYAMAIACGNLSVYYQLTRYIERPEVFVNKTRKVVR